MALMQTDMELDQLYSFRPRVAEPQDFDDFWRTTVAESMDRHSPLVRHQVRTPIKQFNIVDLEFSGFGGDVIRGWAVCPRSERPLPAVVQFVGYGGGRGLPWEHLQWASAGYVHIIMDTRGQGSAWGTGGQTADPHGSGPAAPGFVTKGIENQDSYYYRRLFTDAICLLEDVALMPEVDENRIAVIGGSQGGSIALASAALSARVQAAIVDVPFLCNIERAIRLTPEPPFTEITQYLSIHRGQEDNVLEVLSYFDGVNFAKRLTCPLLMSVALMDDLVIPSTVFSAYNHCPSEDKQLTIFPYNGHEGGAASSWSKQVEWMDKQLPQ